MTGGEAAPGVRPPARRRAGPGSRPAGPFPEPLLTLSVRLCVPTQCSDLGRNSETLFFLSRTSFFY